MTFSPDGKRIATAAYHQNQQGAARVWNAETGQLVRARSIDDRGLLIEGEGGQEDLRIGKALAVVVIGGDGPEKPGESRAQEESEDEEGDRNDGSSDGR